MFFAATNLLKVPPYFALGQFSADNLFASATLFPIAIVSTFAGVFYALRRSEAYRLAISRLDATKRSGPWSLQSLKLKIDGSDRVIDLLNTKRADIWRLSLARSSQNDAGGQVPPAQ